MYLLFNPPMIRNVVFAFSYTILTELFKLLPNPYPLACSSIFYINLSHSRFKCAMYCNVFLIVDIPQTFFNP